MILPKKHLSFEESVLGFSAYLLRFIEKKPSIDRLWSYYLYDYENDIYEVKFDFDQYIITIDYLFSIGAIDIDEKGLLYICN